MANIRRGATPSRVGLRCTNLPYFEYSTRNLFWLSSQISRPIRIPFVVLTAQASCPDRRYPSWVSSRFPA